MKNLGRRQKEYESESKTHCCGCGSKLIKTDKIYEYDEFTGEPIYIVVCPRYKEPSAIAKFFLWPEDPKHTRMFLRH